jgi:citrate synthase
MTDLVTSTNSVVRATKTNLAACVTGAVESIFGNHGALQAFRVITVDAL